MLNAHRLPARLNSAQVAALLGFAEHDVPILVRAGILVPLGKPRANATKYFSREDVEECGRDRKRLAKATAVLYEHWQTRRKPDGAISAYSSEPATSA